jgi:DNA-3-methyladenine glycosylase
MSIMLVDTLFSRSTPTIARFLLGKYLVRRRGTRTIRARIVDVEAYDGPHDKASHASRGKTARNAVMFGPPGRWYVYFTYGMHWMLNVVTGEEGYPAAVLIRGVEVDGVRVNGPARTTKLLGIGKRFNGMPANKRTGLWIEDAGRRVRAERIERSARIGVGYAGPFWSRRKWRFTLER